MNGLLMYTPKRCCVPEIQFLYCVPFSSPCIFNFMYISFSLDLLFPGIIWVQRLCTSLAPPLIHCEFTAEYFHVLILMHSFP